MLSTRLWLDKRLFQEPGEVVVFPGFSRPGPISKTGLNPDLAHDLALARRSIVMRLVQRVRGQSKRRRITIRIRIGKRMKSTRERRELRPSTFRPGTFRKSERFLESRVASWAKTIAAIFRSIVPIRRRDWLSSRYFTAAPSSKSRTTMYRKLWICVLSLA